MPAQDVLELHTAAAADATLDEKLYERELALCVKAGGDEKALREAGYNVFQLEQIRQGYEDHLDVPVYLHPQYSWLDMEEIRKGLKQGIDMTKYREAGYSTAQKREIRKGIARGLDVSQYDAQSYLSEQMKQIRFGLMDKLPVMFYSNPSYNAAQMEEIRLGLKSNIDISSYAHPEYPYLKMRAVRKSMEDGLRFDEHEIARYEDSVLEQLHKAHLSGVDIRPYLEQGYNALQLEQIRISLEEGLHFKPFISKDMRGESLKEIRLGLEAHLDVKPYAKVDYHWRQMREIRLGLEARVDTTKYDNPLFDHPQMREIRIGLEKGLDVEAYNSLIYTAYDMRQIRHALERGETVTSRPYLGTHPDRYGDPVLPEKERPDREALRQALSREKERLQARREGKETPLSDAEKEKDEKLTALLMPSADSVPISLYGGARPQGGKKEKDTKTPAKIDMQGHSIVVTEDKMACYINLPKPSDGVKYTETVLYALLAKSNVVRGIDDALLKSIIRDERYGEQLIIARGTAPVNGADGKYEYHFDRRSIATPALSEDGTADFSGVRFFSEVHAGDVIATYVHAKKGTDGYTVTGEKIPARGGLEKPVLKGRGFLLMDDKVSYAAAVSGIASTNGYELNINRLLTLTEDNLEQMGYGHEGPKKIDFLGSVYINCNLHPGSSINAQGDVIVESVAESLQIKAGGEVVLKEGATGRTPGVIEAKGAVSGKHFSNYTIETEGSVFANSFLHCNITTEEKVVCFGDNGTIYGGKIDARLGLECAVVGTQNGTRTTISIGVNTKMWDAYHEQGKRLERIEQELGAFTKEMERIASLRLQTKEQLQWKIKIGAAHALKQKEYDEALSQIEETEAHIKSVEGAQAQISRILYSGTVFIVDESILQITTTKESDHGIVIKGREKHWKTLAARKSSES